MEDGSNKFKLIKEIIILKQNGDVAAKIESYNLGVDNLTKTNSGDIVLIASNNLIKNLDNNPIYKDFKSKKIKFDNQTMSNNLSKDNITFLQYYISYNEKKNGLNSAIKIKGTYIHPKGVVSVINMDNKKESHNVDNEIIIVDDISLANEVVKKETKKTETKQTEIKKETTITTVKPVTTNTKPVSNITKMYGQVDKLAGLLQKNLDTGKMTYSQLDDYVTNVTDKIEIIIPKTKNTALVKVLQYLEDKLSSLSDSNNPILKNLKESGINLNNVK